ncbi:MAG: hypothetical protein M3R38_11640 [Actinomycetota bacterium]|nr:hypothetical protein [Actinomycetota bacterium]
MRLGDEDLFSIALLIPSAEELADRAKAMTSEDVTEAEALEFGDAVRWALLGVLQELRRQEIEEQAVLAAVEKAVREISG